MQQHFAYLLAGRSSARLSRDRHRNAVSAQGSRQFLDLRALAAAVKAFKGNKFSARCHVGMIAGALTNRRRVRPGDAGARASAKS